MKKDGILNINKPAGMTSFKCADKVRRITGAAKAGHAGTLDPNAEGVLPVCINKGTKCMDFFLEMGKSYRGRIKFGSSTDTMDAWGQVTQTGDTSGLTEGRLLEALEKFKGEIYQLPPQYSAIKKDGVPLYKLARKGVFTDIEPRKINIYELKLLSFSGDEAEIYVKCSKGTYIRVLINDIGEEIGCFAHMSALTRLSYGFLKIEESITLEQLALAVENGSFEDRIVPVSKLTERFASVDLDDEEFKDFKDGKNVVIAFERLAGQEELRKDALNLRSGGELAAVAHAEETDRGLALIPWKYFGKTEG